jgi:Putative Actinobacterial Holin-X, holin superfamily III
MKQESAMQSPERPFSEVLSNIFGNVENMLRGELRLIKAEAREEIVRASRGAGWVAAGVLSALFAVGFLLVGIFFALLFIVPNWAAALIIAAALGLISTLTLQVGGNKRRSTEKENLAWAKHQVR